MKAKLVVVGGGVTKTTEVELQLPAIIGRGRSAQITIPHSLVSRQHCELIAQDGKLLVRDLESLNGTYVGDQQITESVLEPGALLTVGTVTFRAVYEVESVPASNEIIEEDKTPRQPDCSGDSTVNGVLAVGEDTASVNPPASVSAILPPQAEAAHDGDDTVATDTKQAGAADLDALAAFLNKRK